MHEWQYHTTKERLRFVNLPVFRVCRVRGIPVGTNYALCNMITPEPFTAACGQRGTYVGPFAAACSSK